jgi:hypothetical protein
VLCKLTKILAVVFRYSLGELAALPRGESVVFCFLVDEGEPAEESAGDEPKLNGFSFSGVVVRDDPLVL